MRVRTLVSVLRPIVLLRMIDIMIVLVLYMTMAWGSIYWKKLPVSHFAENLMSFPSSLYMPVHFIRVYCDNYSCIPSTNTLPRPQTLFYHIHRSKVMGRDLSCKIR